MGGFISLTMAAKHPSKIGKVVMVGSRGSGPDLEVGSIDLNPNHFDNLENLKLHLMEGLFTHGLDDPGRLLLVTGVTLWGLGFWVWYSHFERLLRWVGGCHGCNRYSLRH